MARRPDRLSHLRHECHSQPNATQMNFNKATSRLVGWRDLIHAHDLPTRCRTGRACAWQHIGKLIEKIIISKQHRACFRNLLKNLCRAHSTFAGWLFGNTYRLNSKLNDLSEQYCSQEKNKHFKFVPRAAGAKNSSALNAATYAPNLNNKANVNTPLVVYIAFRSFSASWMALLQYEWALVTERELIEKSRTNSLLTFNLTGGGKGKTFPLLKFIGAKQHFTGTFYQITPRQRTQHDEIQKRV